MKTDDVTAILKGIREYERSSYGVKFGADFPAFAESVMASDEFTGLIKAQIVVGALELLSVRDKESIERMVNNSHLRDQLLIAIYAGWQLGKREAEISALESAMKEGRS